MASPKASIKVALRSAVAMVLLCQPTGSRSEDLELVDPCAEVEQQFQAVLSGERDLSPEFLTEYCASECFSSAVSLSAAASEEARQLKVQAMRRLCLKRGEEFCFPAFAAALQQLAEVEDDPLSAETWQTVCTPCARQVYRELLGSLSESAGESSPLELLCARDSAFCFVRTRHFLEELEFLDATCDPAEADCQAQLLDFARQGCQQDPCVSASLQRIAHSRFAETSPEELGAALDSLRQLSCRIASSAPTAERWIQLQQILGALQEELECAGLLFQPTELLDLEFSGAKF